MTWVDSLPSLLFATPLEWAELVNHTLLLFLLNHISSTSMYWREKQPLQPQKKAALWTECVLIESNPYERFSNTWMMTIASVTNWTTPKDCPSTGHFNFQPAFSMGRICLRHWMCLSPGECSALCSGFGADRFDQTGVQRGRAARRVPVTCSRLDKLQRHTLNYGQWKA